MRLLTLKEAAEYTGLPFAFFQNQIKHHTGPAYISPSARGAKFFDQHALDEWIATWDRKPQKATA